MPYPEVRSQRHAFTSHRRSFTSLAPSFVHLARTVVRSPRIVCLKFVDTRCYKQSEHVIAHQKCQYTCVVLHRPPPCRFCRPGAPSESCCSWQHPLRIRQQIPAPRNLQLVCGRHSIRTTSFLCHSAAWACVASSHQLLRDQQANNPAAVGTHTPSNDQNLECYCFGCCSASSFITNNH